MFVCCHEPEAPPGGAELVNTTPAFQTVGLRVDADCMDGQTAEGLVPAAKQGKAGDGGGEPQDLGDAPFQTSVNAPSLLSEDGGAKARRNSRNSTRDRSLSGLRLGVRQAANLPSLGDVEILRVTSITNVLHNCGVILRNSSGSQDTYSLSKSRQWIDIFISHNWAVHRWKKFWALTLYFNLVHAALAAYICVAFGCLLNIHAVPPILRLHEDEAGGAPMAGVHCLILGSLGFFSALVLGHDFPLVGRVCCKQQVFLDKICIHQTDPDLKAAGIKSLGAFLRYSTKMLVLFNSFYCKRLWTVYEAACYMYLHGGEELELLPVDIASVVLKSTASIIVLFLVNRVTVHFASSSAGDSFANAVAASLVLACLIILSCILRDWALQESKLFAELESFHIARADCSDERDRAVVSRNICAFAQAMELTEEGASDEDSLESFDRLVQERMPELLRSAVGRVGFPYKYTLVVAIGTDFRMFDEISSAPNASTLVLLSTLVEGLMVRAVLIPGVFLACSWMSSTFRRLSRWGEVALKLAISVAGAVVTGFVLMLDAALKDWAKESVWGLVGFASTLVVLALAVAGLFRRGEERLLPRTSVH